MKYFKRFSSFLAVLMVLSVTNAFSQEVEPVVPDMDFPDEYIKVTHDRAYDFVKEMDLSPEKTKKVTEIVAKQYRNLSAIQDTRDSQIKLIEDKFEEKDTRQALIRETKIKAKMQENALHRQFIAKLLAEITPEQVTEIKNGMTYNTAHFTYKGYVDLLPELTEEQKKQVRAYLYEAREFAMDAGSSDAKHRIFGDYKGKINNYLSSEGYNLNKAEERQRERNKNN